jgi:hypothetical protein
MARLPSPAPLARPRGAPRPAATERAILTETSWSPRHELRLADWVRHGHSLGSIGRASGWWIGDWVRFGNSRYGERYEVAARITGYDAHSLMNMAYVASRFEVSRRRERLSFSHHAELAALPFEEQERWLDRAEREGLSSRRLRRELRRHAGPSVRRAPPEDAAVVCPRCGHHFEQRGGRGQAPRAPVDV